MELFEKVSVAAATTTTPPAKASFAKPALFGDFPEVPVDKRYRTVTKFSFETVMDTTQAAQDFCTTLWGQDRNIASAEMIRWVSSAIAPRFVMTDFGTVLATWQGVTVGDFAITDGSATEQFATGTFASVSDLDDIAAVIQAKIRTSSSFAADLSAAVVGFDALGRMYFETATPGEAATTYTIIAPAGGAGTDITTENFLNIASRAFVVAGMDAEDPDDALADVVANHRAASFYTVHETGASASQAQALAVAARIYRKMAMFDISDVLAKDSSSTTDLAYLLHAASVDAYGVYNEHSGSYGKSCAAANGQILPRDAGSASLANKQLKNIYESGLGADGSSVIPLTATERGVLDAKGCDYLVNPTGALLHLERGLLFSGLEFKTRWGLDWWEYLSAVEIAGYLYNNEVTFSDIDIATIVGILTKNLDILINRTCLESYTVTIPKAADISAAIKATHHLTLNDVAQGIAAYAVNTVAASIQVQA